MERPNVNSDKVGHQTVAENSVQKVAHATGHNKRKADETCHLNPSAACQVCKEGDQANSNTQREDGEPSRLREEGSETQKRTGIFSKPQLDQSTRQRHGTHLAQSGPGDVFRGLIAADRANEQDHKKGQTEFAC
jgi:hypothetical protein